jgi:hypothetical protein
MDDEPSITCPYCHTTLKPDEMAVFRNSVRIGHLHCWRDYRPLRDEGEVPPPVPSSRRADMAAITSTRPSEQPRAPGIWSPPAPAPVPTPNAAPFPVSPLPGGRGELFERLQVAESGRDSGGMDPRRGGSLRTTVAPTTRTPRRPDDDVSRPGHRSPIGKRPYGSSLADLNWHWPC